MDIRERCVGGFDTPFGRVPPICVFSADPDINPCINIGGIVTSEISVTARPVVRYYIDPARSPGMSDLDAEDSGIPNKWQVFLDPVTPVDVDVFDIADMVGDLLENAVQNAINDLLSFLPRWARDLIWDLLGSVINLIRYILDIPDDIVEWLTEKLGVSLGLFETLKSVVADYLINQFPIAELEDPYPILESTGALIPVKIPVEDLTVQVNTNEMIVEANVGA